MRNKKFKTVLGYLRSVGEGIRDEKGERQTINNLLPKIGISGGIEPNEKPWDGIHRLRQTVQDERHIKALNDCVKWLRRPHYTVTTKGELVSSKTIAKWMEESK
jgi:hypothetical protein